MGDGKDHRKGNHKDFAQSDTCIRINATKKAHRVLVIGDFSLRGTETPICCADVSPERFSAYWGPIFAISQKSYQAWWVLKTINHSYFFI